jgi:hypothetical protein
MIIPSEFFAEKFSFFFSTLKQNLDSQKFKDDHEIDL